ncbi:MAG: hypothetical protein A2033_13800 [Bacteroidetes bacterium GWA2_31_9]|nr:MAG: hypothetical protein A2033_13800 [Bacteroidetes bacterium GWA2_31_9]
MQLLVKSKYLIVLLLIIFSCKKKVENYNTDYIGSWSGSVRETVRVFINIYDDSHGNYYCMKTSDGDSEKIKGTVRVNKNRLSIGIHNFKIVSPPEKIIFNSKSDSVYIEEYYFRELATWKMTLINPLFYGSDEVTYYK